MQRNENKVERNRKKQEEIDDRLREAGMYEDGLDQEAKAQLLQFLEESRESARIEEEERQSLLRQEQRMIAETLSKSSKNKETGSSSSSSNRYRKEEVDVEETVVVSRTPTQHTRREASVTPKSNVASVIKSTSDTVMKLHTQAQDEDEDLVLLSHEEADDPECQVIKTSTNDTPIKRKGLESVREISPTTPGHTRPSPMAISPVLSKSRMTSTNTITSTVMADDDSDSNTMSPRHKSPQVQKKRLPNPHVLLVPLSQALSPRKNVISSPGKEVTAPGSVISAIKSLNFSQEKNVPHNSVLSEKSSFQKNVIIGNSSPSSEDTVVFSPELASSSDLRNSGSITPLKDANIHKASKKSATPNFTKNSTTPSIKRNITSSFVEDSSPYKKCPSPVSSSSGAFITMSTPSSATSDAAPTHALATSTTITTTTSDKEVEELESSQEVSPESDPDDKITLRTAILRSINVFSHNPAKEVILRRKRPLPSEVAGKSYYRGPSESLQQCRSRILALMDNMNLRLQQYQSTLPALAWPPPLTVDWRLKNSLERARPASRRVVQRKQLEEELEREDFKQRHTRQTAKYSREASNSLPGPSRGEGSTRARRIGNGRTLGLRRWKKPAVSLFTKETSDSDSDGELLLNQPSSSSYQNSPVSHLMKGEGIPGDSKNQESQPQQRRKTFRLDSGSDGSDNECCVEADAGRPDNLSSNYLSPGASPTDPLADLCIIEDEEPQPKLPRPAIRRLARRGTRRPAPEPSGSAPTKLRKTHTLNTEASTTGSVPEHTTQPSPDSSDFTPTFEDASGWNSEQRQNQEEQEEEKMPCPICQRFYPMQEIEVHASDCTGMEDRQEEEFNRGSRRLRRLNDESAGAVVSSSDKYKESNKKQICILCKESFSSPDDLQIHLQSCHRMEEEEEDEDDFCQASSPSSSAIHQTNKRTIKVPGRTLRQEVTRSKGGLSQPGSLINNKEDKHSNL